MLTNRNFTAFTLLILALACCLALADGGLKTQGLNRVLVQNFTSEAQSRCLQGGSTWRYPVSAVSTDDVAAEASQRSVAFGESVVLRFVGLQEKALYKVRVEYLSDSNDRVQAMYAGDVLLKDDIKLPRGKVLVEVVDLPGSVIADGRVELKFVKKEGPNAAVASVELWSDSKELLPVMDITASGDLTGTISGVVADVNADRPAANTIVSVSCNEFSAKVVSMTDDRGRFSVDLPQGWRDAELFRVIAGKDGAGQSIYVPVEEVFKPRLTPLPKSIAGVDAVKVDLTGVWKFLPNCGDDLSRVTKQVAEKWYDIEVPGEWVMQGFEVEKEMPGGYFRQFNVPKDWAGKRVKLRCDAVYSDSTIWVNGQKAGGHKGGMTPFEIDVTEFVKAGNNSIAMTVTNESLADVLASGSQYAVHQLGGISRKLYLFAVEELNIASMHVETVFDEKFDDSTMRVLLTIANEGSRDIKNASIDFGLRKKGSRKNEDLEENKFKLPLIKAGQEIEHVVEIRVDSPDKWDCEHPNLYYLTCNLKKRFKRIATATVTKRFGFRQVEIRGNQVFVNNMPVKLHGVCRHEAHPARGRSLTREQWRADAELFRAANCNYIRTSHYPPAEEFIEYCDELGLFVEQEAPLCWVGHGANATWQKWNPHSSEYLRTILKATMEMIERDRSHPSVLIWSLANESQWGPNFVKSFELANIADPTRPKAFHDQSWGGYNNNGSFTQVANLHYPGPGGFKNADKESSVRPQLFGEYCHLNAYNRNELFTDQSLRDAWGRGFEVMWDGMYNTKGMLGGALWSGIDDSFFLPDGRVVGYGTWGPIDGWRRPKPEYWHTKKIYSPVRIRKTTIAKPGPGKQIELEIENRHDFTNINELKIDWAIGSVAGTASSDIAPNSKGKLVIPYATDDAAAEKLMLTFTSPRGFEIDRYAITIGDETSAGDESKTIAAKPKVTKADGRVTIAGDGFSYVFDSKTGMIVEGVVGGKKVVTGGPHLLVLALNGAGGTQMTGTDNYEPFTDPLANWHEAAVSVTETDAAVVIETTGKYDKAEGTYYISITGDGKMTAKYDFTSLADVNPRQVGLVFDLDGGCRTLAWKRRGQWSVYPDDHIGRTEGVAKAFVGSQKSGTAGPSFEPSWPWAHDANKMGTNDFRSTKENIYWATLSDDDGLGVKLVSDGSGSVRCWVDGDKVRVLGANYVNPGAERFYRRHARMEDKPLKKGDSVKGSVELLLNSTEELE
ncbi:MAG: hypothetical protein KAS23_12040 [Anaerohalosphaera sp.]|nr:hypothetical protein [Anaerohalosphaera sp.]